MAINIKRVFAALIDYMIIVAVSTTVAVLCDGGEVTPFSGTVFLLLVFLIALFKGFCFKRCEHWQKSIKNKSGLLRRCGHYFSKFFKRTITFVPCACGIFAPAEKQQTNRKHMGKNHNCPRLSNRGCWYEEV